MRYHVRHETEYVYDGDVTVSRQALHLAPRALPWQRCLRHELEIDPAPTLRSDETDCFGNPLTRLEIDAPHRRLFVAADLEVELDARPPVALDDSPPLGDVAQRFDYVAGRVPDGAVVDASRFRSESPFVRINADLVAYARATLVAGKPLLAACDALMRRIHAEFRYEAGATHAATPLSEVFELRRGVCQDFAHVMIGCLRSAGLPARYVSGYLRTTPPAGQPQLVGADASHAWVSVFCPVHGWVDFDPTNNVRPQLDHVTLGFGRDFGDVSPMRGVILGGGNHRLRVGVTVSPVDDGTPAPAFQGG
jgi:transglutaminase-like putative cysteine protease